MKEEDTYLEGYEGHQHVRSEGHLADSHINVQEMGAVYTACDRWGEQRKDRTVMLVTDSAVIQAALSMGRSRSEGIMYYMRRLFWLLEGITFNSNQFTLEVKITSYVTL